MTGEIEARCLLAFTLFIGSHFMVADHGGRTRRETTELAMKQIIS